LIFSGNDSAGYIPGTIYPLGIEPSGRIPNGTENQMDTEDPQSLLAVGCLDRRAPRPLTPVGNVSRSYIQLKAALKIQMYILST
jgi:hypothetical protein